ncbi:hypothetical protein BS333_17445 [Vibrio azureus]|uniref:Uncharacterized protein n=1 Tax=Vibrio azureus NBRC 104587 TaxID=1219077 RepID=U3ANT6_9VIBR|nr:hypothetical protein [Vibrio azureus]AUI88144.1 hypothetical protein BS333_17445 [Vibrio azureus]GAD74962.1 hypothetical protein VAZ01S_017_00570 [Vibrio azureus NBRC 104587]
MNLEALKEIIRNHPEILEESARDSGADESVVMGIAKFSSRNGYEVMSEHQKYHFDKSIRHLVEDVQCSGYTHEFEEEHQECLNILDDDDLVEYYQNDGGYCESCQGQSDADAHSKASFMAD